MQIFFAEGSRDSMKLAAQYSKRPWQSDKTPDKELHAEESSCRLKNPAFFLPVLQEQGRRIEACKDPIESDEDINFLINKNPRSNVINYSLIFIFIFRKRKAAMTKGTFTCKYATIELLYLYI